MARKNRKLINIGYKHREFIRLGRYDRVLDSIDDPLFNERPSSEQELLLRNKRTIEQQMATILDRINANIALLPPNYHAITPSALTIDRQFKFILASLQNNQVGEAWLLFSNMSRLTKFIKYTFPHLEAMWHQIQAAFQIIDANGYSILPEYWIEPDDKKLRKYRLSLYAKNSQIWCATINQQDEIERFIIDARQLGKEANDILILLEKNTGMLSDQQKNIIYLALAKRGYYRRNETGYSGASIEAALTNFSKVYQLIRPSRPSLAERLHEETIVPLQAMMQAAKEANETTSDEERRSISIPEREDTRRMLLAGNDINDHLYFDDEEWNALLLGEDVLNNGPSNHK